MTIKNFKTYFLKSFWLKHRKKAVLISVSLFTLILCFDLFFATFIFPKIQSFQPIKIEVKSNEKRITDNVIIEATTL